MPEVATVSLWLALAVGAGMTLFLLKARWNYSRLPTLGLMAGHERPDVSVIIPARDEEANISRVVRSLAWSRVYVVDDGSTDQTAMRARKAGATVVTAPPLPPGFVGKPHACWAGARSTTSQWLLFVDADTWYEPRFVESLLTYATQESLDAVSVYLRHEFVSTAERALMPFAFALYFCGVSAASLNSPGRREVPASGHCLLFRREAYTFLGGHGAVARSAIDDMDLASRAKRRGMKVRIVRGDRLGSIRMYKDWRSVRRGFQRNSLRLLLASPWLFMQVGLAGILMTGFVPVLVYLGIQGWWSAIPPFAALPSLLMRPWYGSWKNSLLAPLAIYCFDYIALRSLLSTVFRRPVEWKGRRLRG